jgi:hypothetical protein
VKIFLFDLVNILFLFSEYLFHFIKLYSRSELIRFHRIGFRQELINITKSWHVLYETYVYSELETNLLMIDIHVHLDLIHYLRGAESILVS